MGRPLSFRVLEFLPENSAGLWWGFELVRSWYNRLEVKGQGFSSFILLKWTAWVKGAPAFRSFIFIWRSISTSSYSALKITSIIWDLVTARMLWRNNDQYSLQKEKHYPLNQHLYTLPKTFPYSTLKEPTCLKKPPMINPLQPFSLKWFVSSSRNSYPNKSVGSFLSRPRL